MSHMKKLQQHHDTSSSPHISSGEEDAQRLQLKKENIEKRMRERKRAVANRASEILKKIESAISRIDKQITAAPAQNSLRQLNENYKELEGRAKALSQLMTNPHEHIELHSIDDHHEHEIHHDGSLNEQFHDFHAICHEVRAINEDALKLHQQEYLYNRHRARSSSHPTGTWVTSRARELPEKQRQI